MEWTWMVNTVNSWKLNEQNSHHPMRATDSPSQKLLTNCSVQLKLCHNGSSLMAHGSCAMTRVFWVRWYLSISNHLKLNLFFSSKISFHLQWHFYLFLFFFLHFFSCFRDFVVVVGDSVVTCARAHVFTYNKQKQM